MKALAAKAKARAEEKKKKKRDDVNRKRKIEIEERFKKRQQKSLENDAKKKGEIALNNMSYLSIFSATI